MKVDIHNVSKISLKLLWISFKIFLICFFIMYSLLSFASYFGIYIRVEEERFASESPDGKYCIHIMDENFLIFEWLYKSSIYIENVESGEMIRYYSTKYTGEKVTSGSSSNLTTYNNIKINWYDEYVDIIIEVFIPLEDYSFDERFIQGGVITYRIDYNEVSFD